VVILRRRCPILSIPLSNHDPSKKTIHSYRSHCKMVVILKRTNSFYRPRRDPSKMSDLIDPSKKVSVLIDPIKWLRSLGEERYPVFSIPSNGRDPSKMISIPLNDVRSYRSFEVDIRSDRFHQMVLILRRRYSVSIPSISDSWTKAIRSYRSHCKWSRFLEECRSRRDPSKRSRFLEENHPFLSIPLQMVVILGRKLSVLIDPVANGRDSWKNVRCYRSRRDPSKVLFDPIKWSRFLEENHPFLSIPLQMVVILGRKLSVLIDPVANGSLSVLIDPIANGRDSWKNFRFIDPVFDLG
ncbi:19822_t:CDS:2, partial [Funneliformis geosporum]